MKALLTWLLLVAAIAAPFSARGTAQEPDTLVIDGERLSLETNPLRPMIRSGAIKLPNPDESWTSNWRGYVATWEVSGGKLLLKEINVRLRPSQDPSAKAVPTNVISTVFPGQTEILARWYTGTLVLPRGEVVRYVHMGYGSIHANYSILHIKLGVIVAREDLTAEQFEALRKERFSEYRKTSEYAHRLNEARKNLSPEAARDFLYEYSVEEYMSVEQ